MKKVKGRKVELKPGEYIFGKLLHTDKKKIKEGKPIKVNVNGHAYRFAHGVASKIPIEVVAAIKDAVTISHDSKEINLDKGEVRDTFQSERFIFYPVQENVKITKEEKTKSKIIDDVLAEAGA